MINDVFADLTECDTMTRGIYIVWWDNDFNYEAEADDMLDRMLGYRDACLNDLGMMDPPNPIDGYFYNVYIHTPDDTNDLFEAYGWGNGQGTDVNGYPFLTLPSFTLNDYVNLAHETFHIFQYNASSPGFAYSGDSQWYIEASANWFAAIENPAAPRAFVEGESLVRLPQVPLWLSFDNFPATYPENWQRYVHQYALSLWLYYLTEVAGVSPELITEGFFTGTSETPQEYLFNELGADSIRIHFMNWIEAMRLNFNFISPSQAFTLSQEWDTYADPTDDFEIIRTFYDENTDGWYRPSLDSTTHAWSFNVFKFETPVDILYRVEFKGDPVGTYGDSSHFQIRLCNFWPTGNCEVISVTDDLEADEMFVLYSGLEAYLIIAATPEVFSDSNPEFQQFPYELRISRSPTNGLDQYTGPRSEIGRYNLLGQPVNQHEQGIQFIHYSDGSIEKVFQPHNN